MAKSAHFLPIQRTHSLEKLAELYKNEIVQLHGMLVSIVSDRDPRFTSSFWKSLHRAMGTKLTLSTTFHQQTDGQSKRTIQTLKDMLRACMLDFKGSWEKHLPLVQFSYNNSFHASIGMAQYEALYGRKYKLRLPPNLSSVHDIFHVSMLRKYVYDPSHVFEYEPLMVHENLTYEEKPVRILDQKNKFWGIE